MLYHRWGNQPGVLGIITKEADRISGDWQCSFLRTKYTTVCIIWCSLYNTETLQKLCIIILHLSFFTLSRPPFFLPSLTLSFSYLPRKHLHQKDIVLNYKDSSGDLVEMTSNEDIELMKSEGISPQIKFSGTHAPWAIYVTVAGGHNPYNTSPYK